MIRAAIAALGLLLLAVSNLTAQDSLKDIEDMVDKKFPIPDYPPVGKLLGDWTNIPAPVFPRDVVVAKDLPIAGIKKGEKMVAVSWKNPNLFIARAADSKTLVPVALDDTDMKQVMTDLYADWSARHRRSLMAKRSAEKRRLFAEWSAKQTGATVGTPANPPMQAATAVEATDPRMKPMVASIKSGTYPELKRAVITSWHWLGKETIGGKTYETGTVEYKVQTAFGKIDTSAKALIVNGRVERWIYTCTGEPVSTLR